MRTKLRNLTLSLIVGLALAGPAIAQDDAAIEGVIRQQLDAFLAGDVDAAWGYASPEIQRLFGNPENFGRMVERGYPMVWAPGDVRFGALSESDGGLWQTVIVQDAEGALHALQYQMEQVDGSWRIAGVRFAPVPQVSA
ncbi:DUF4864 domain-containing protein [Salipiger bermudensis]|uniref:DUF4864 domain-containing protein n=1 Tax=Salipiger bermudensis TaxID=344736 RepID=UPI001C994EF7|nr:DUF4864 domain-containing protein [Salipiger bermudensis]MBY6003343.1 DUF4864 domain-containing protein [Salipiger bermudensis]